MSQVGEGRPYRKCPDCEAVLHDDCLTEFSVCAVCRYELKPRLKIRLLSKNSGQRRSVRLSAFEVELLGRLVKRVPSLKAPGAYIMTVGFCWLVSAIIMTLNLKLGLLTMLGLVAFVVLNPPDYETEDEQQALADQDYDRYEELRQERAINSNAVTDFARYRVEAEIYQRTEMKLQLLTNNDGNARTMLSEQLALYRARQVQRCARLRHWLSLKLGDWIEPLLGELEPVEPALQERQRKLREMLGRPVHPGLDFYAKDQESYEIATTLQRLGLIQIG